MPRAHRMLLVTVAAIGADTLVVALIVGALILEQVYRVGTDGIFDATLGMAIVFVVVAGLCAMVAQGHRRIAQSAHASRSRVHPPHFLT